MRLKSLTIERLLYETMLAAVQRAYPLEACGFLAGLAGRATHLYPIDNRLQSPVAFEMEPGQQIEAMIDIEERGWVMLAIYHSHPQGPETPSPTDVARAYYPEAIQVIISLQQRSQPVVRAFTIRDSQVTEVPLLVV